MATYIKIKILSRYDYQTFPITEDMIEVSETDLSRIGIDKCFDIYSQSIVNYVKLEDGESVHSIEENTDIIQEGEE